MTSFCVKKEEIAAGGYDLSFNRYKEILFEEEEHREPEEIVEELEKLEEEFRTNLNEVKEMLP